MTANLLRGYRRIVVKIGSSLLVDRERGLKRTWLESLGEDIARLRREGCEIVVVSSGAIALGRKLLRLPKGALKLEQSQAAAAVGQIALSRSYLEILGRHELKIGQVLLTLGDTEERRRYLNARATITTLLEYDAVPVINENDTVATSEIRYGDNDRLAARVATMIDADLLVLLSDIDGLYTAPPATHPDAEHIAVVPAITAEIEAMAGSAGSELSRGGMKTKIDAGRIATSSGTAMIITAGDRLYPLKAIEDGERATFFHPAGTPVNARKRWIAGHLAFAGTLTVDGGAAQALRAGKSLLPAGVTHVAGDFTRGDTVSVLDADGHEIARGVIAYDAAEARSIAGLRSAEIEHVLGYAGRSAMIHRDDLAVGRVANLEPSAATDGRAGA